MILTQVRTTKRYVSSFYLLQKEGKYVFILQQSLNIYNA